MEIVSVNIDLLLEQTKNLEKPCNSSILCHVELDSFLKETE